MKQSISGAIASRSEWHIGIPINEKHCFNVGPASQTVDQ